MAKVPIKTAVIVANGADCSPALTQAILADASFVLVLDGAIHRVLAQGLRVDAWLGDFDSHTAPPTALPSHIKIIHTPDQNKTDLDKAIAYLIEAGHTQAYILWATGRRADHTFVNISSLVRFQTQIELILVDDYSIVTTGLVYNLNNDTLRIGYRTSSSNEAISNEPICVYYETGDMLLMVAFDDPTKHPYFLKNK